MVTSLISAVTESRSEKKSSAGDGEASRTNRREEEKNEMNTILTLSELRASPPRYMSVREGALYLTVSDRFLRDQIANRRIRFAKVGGRIVLRRVDLDLFIENRLSDYCL